MKRKMGYIVAALCLICLLLPWAFCAQAEGTEELPPAIRISGLKKTDEGYAVQVALDGYKGQGDKVLLALYDQSGRMKQLRAFKPDFGLTLDASGVDPTDKAKVMWVNSDYSPVCSAAKVAFTYTVERFSSWFDFAGETSEIISEYDYVSVSGDFNSKGDGAYASGRLIVKTKGELPDVSAYFPMRVITDGSAYYILQFADAQQARECAAYLSGVEGVVYAEPDVVLYADEDIGDESTADAVSGYSWGVAATYAGDYAVNLKERGKTDSIVVAVVDSGVDFNHSFLKSRLTSNGYDFVDNDSNPTYVYNGHGTHVSGTIVDCTPGLNVRIMPIRALKAEDKKVDGRASGYTTNIANGIKYAANHGASVINLSLGGTHSGYYEDAIKYVIGKGVTVVVSAGNSSKNLNTYNICPAHISSAITVSAVNSSKKLASFSNYGSSVDIAAPGVDIKSSIPGNRYDSWQGTSMAAPHVSAAAAMLLLDYPGLSCSQVESKLRSAATDLGTSGFDIYFGAGFLNLKPFISNGYTVSYNANGGTGAPASQTKVRNVTLKLSTATPTRKHTVTFNNNGGSGSTTSKTVYATFKNWNTKADGSGASYASGANYTGNAALTLYAQWTLGKVGTLPTPTRSGYTFAGWYTASSGGSKISDSTLVSGNVTYYAHWSKTYTVSYNANEGTGAPGNQIKEKDVALKLSTVIPTRKHAIVFDYNDGTGRTYANTIYATFKNWNIKANGGSTSYASGANYTKNADVTLYAQWTLGKVGNQRTPTRSGYEFLGWYTAASGGTKITESTDVKKDATYYAHWAKIYPVEYNANGGTGAPEDQNKLEGISLKLSTVKPTKAFTVYFDNNDGTGISSTKALSASFKNWNTKANGSGTAYSSGASYTKNAELMLYAQYSAVKVGTLPTPTKAGGVFKGWYTEPNSGSKIGSSTKVDGDITYYAHWEKTYTVQYNANGGTGAPATQNKKQDATLKLSTTKPVQKYTITFDNNDGTGKTSTVTVSATFNGWNTKRDGSGTAFAPGASYKENANLILYAQWTVATVGKLPAPTHAGFDFLGWYTAPSGGSPISSSTAVYRNTTYYAQWGKSYKVSYNANGGTGAPEAQIKVENVPLQLTDATPSRKHTVTFKNNDGSSKKTTVTVYETFKSWNTQADGRGSTYYSGGSYRLNADVTLYAQWTLSAIGTLPTPARSGYKLLGWYTESSGGSKISEYTTVSENVTYYAHWAKGYAVSYNANGGSNAPANQTKEQDIPLRLTTDKPVREYTVTFNHNDGDGTKTARVVSATFDNWNTKKDGKGTAYAPGASYNENAALTLYAQWTLGTVGALPTPARQGYVFTGWYTSASGGSAITESTVVKSNVTYYAHWVKSYKYTVSYDANGGIGAPESQIKQKDVALNLSDAIPTRTFSVIFDLNHVNANGTVVRFKRSIATNFTKWNTKMNGSGTSYAPGASYTKNADLTLYAQWVPGVIGTLPAPSRQGYVFLGWYTAENGGTRITADMQVGNDMTCYAHWQKE